jgi:hypothetical protein
MASAYLNSIAVTSPAVALPVLLAAFAAYALTFMRMPGADVWYGLIVSLLIVPALVALPPLLRLESDLGIVGTYPVRIPADRWLSWSEVWRRSHRVQLAESALWLPAGGADDGVSWAWKVVDSGRGSGRGGDLSGGRPGAGRGGCSGQDHAGSRRGRPGGPAGAGDDPGREAGDGQRLAGRGDTAADD